MIERILAKADDLDLDRRLVAILGLIAAFIIAILINAVFNLFGAIRMDMTQNKVHTLSKGTKKILNKLENPVILRYYATDSSDIMSPSEIQSAKRIKQKLDEFVRATPSKKVKIADPKTGEFKEVRKPMLTIEKLNPAPNTDAQDLAALDGMQPVMSMENNEMYMGIAVKCIDQTETLPFISPQEENSLEYKLISAISKVSGGSEKIVRVMTSLPVSGGMGANFQPSPKWAFYGLTEQKFKTETLPPTVKEIPEDTACLLVIHPHDITDQGQFAIDQFLLKGGNVIVMVDPNFFYSRSLGGGQPAMPGMPPQQGPPPTSDLKTLFSAWGVKYDQSQVLADVKYGSEILRPGNFSATFLTLNEGSMAGTKDDIVTNMLNHLNMLTPGGFDITTQDGLTVDSLVQSSPQSQFVSSFDADPTQAEGAKRIRDSFKASETNFPLVARLRGNFKTAFPDGDPSTPPPAEPKEGEKEAPKVESTALKESAKPGSVILFADVDFVFDPICIRRQQILGMEAVESLNENLTLLENAIAQSAGDPDMIDVRSRIEIRRPFDRQNDWRREAEDQFKQDLEEYVKKSQETEAELSRLLSSQPENINADLISPEIASKINSLRKERADFNQKVRKLQKEMTREFKRKQNNIKAANIAIVPILVILAGILLAVYRKTRTAAR